MSLFFLPSQRIFVWLCRLGSWNPTLPTTGRRPCRLRNRAQEGLFVCAEEVRGIFRRRACQVATQPYPLHVIVSGFLTAIRAHGALPPPGGLGKTGRIQDL